MAQTIEHTSEGYCFTNGVEACIGVPSHCGSCIDIAAQSVVTTQVTLHALQISSREAASFAQTIDHHIACACNRQAGRLT